MTRKDILIEESKQIKEFISKLATFSYNRIEGSNGKPMIEPKRIEKIQKELLYLSTF